MGVPMVQCDFLVIGSGVAGLMFALEVAEHGRVAVLCKDEPSEGSTRYAQGGIATVISPLDSFESHVQDTMDAGAGLCDEEVVRMVVSQGPERIERLVSLGAAFDKNKDAEDYELGQEGGHSARRILHARDATGAEIHRAVFERAERHPNITLYPHHVAIDLITQPVPGNESSTEVLGVYALDRRQSEVVTFVGSVTMLATGGAGKVYLYTSNPDVSTGDGIAMAFRAGAAIANMEFIQFHPTCLYHPAAKSFLITEAMRGEGARLLTADGQPFMEQYDSRGELAPRDVVARAIDD
ncbi:MAG: FAD-dependent oxidoreductase, partial [Bdellovibrionales bacterium]|nr:FAD-dependent oxidoreductase [Bdellovibrionales bacterium]